MKEFSNPPRSRKDSLAFLLPYFRYTTTLYLSTYRPYLPPVLIVTMVLGSSPRYDSTVDCRTVLSTEGDYFDGRPMFL